jgi:hypothetical protein
VFLLLRRVSKEILGLFVFLLLQRVSRKDWDYLCFCCCGGFLGNTRIICVAVVVEGF